MKLIKIIAQLNPFSTDKSIFEFESDTVSNLLKKIDTNKAVNTGWRVMVDDQIITNFETIVPAGSTVYVKLVPEGDSPEETGAKAGVWVGVVSAIAGAVLLFLPGTQLFGGMLLGVGCVMFTGAGYAYIDIQQQKNQNKEKPESDPSIRGSQNQSRPMQQIPTLLGRRRIYPDLIMNPYTEVDSSGNQYLCQLFCAGQKDQKIETSSIKIEETLLKDYSASKNIDTVLAGNDEHINMKIHYGDSSLSLFKKCVHEQQFNSSLKNKLEDDTSGAVIWTTPAGTTEINVDIFFYNGLAKYNDAGEVESASVTVKAYYKQKDASDSAYQLIGYFKNGSNTISDSQLKTLRYVVSKSGLTADSYTIKVERETVDSESSMVIDEVYLGSIRAFKNSSPVRSEILQKLCVIELKIKATPKLQNIIEKLNFVSQSYLPIYSKAGTGFSSWTTKALSSNPASVAIFAMQGSMAQQKLKDSDIDWMAFEKLYNWCESHNYECNYFLSESISISQLLTNIATCARCEIFRLNGKITVVQDIERDSAVQLFTPRNSKNYTETLLKAEIPDCIALKFVNEESGFAEDEVKVYNTSTGNKLTEPETTQEVSLWGVTNSKQARKVGMYDLAVFRARSVVHTFQCDFEYMLCSKGDWIKYAGDIALAGLKQGRITNLIFNDNGKIIGFRSDELLPMQEENSYAVRIRKNDGTISLYDIVYTEGNHLEVLFSESLQADEIQEENLFAFGIRGQETINLIITSITCQDNLMAEITAVEYAPKIFEVDSPNFTLPDFESNISDIPGVVDSGAVDLSDWKTFYTYNDSSEQPAKPTGNGAENGWHRNSTAKSKWMSSKTSKDVNSGEWAAPSPTGSFVQKEVDELKSTVEELGDTTPPTIPEIKSAEVDSEGNITITFLPSKDIHSGVLNYIVLRKKINEDWIVIKTITHENSKSEYIFTDFTEEKNIQYNYAVCARDKANNTSDKSFSSNIIASVTVKPYSPSQFTAIAEKDKIALSWKPKSTTNDCLRSNSFEIYLSRNNGDSFSFIGQTQRSSFDYIFERIIDSYPEASELNNYLFKIIPVSLYEIKGEETLSAVNTDKYGTWQVNSPEVTFSGNKRFVSLNLTQPKRSDRKEIYGSVGYQILVNRPDLDGEVFFQPATNLDPQASELNYKTESQEPIICSSTYMQEMPLKGQNAKKWKFKYYEKTADSDKTKKDSVTYLDNIDSVIIPDNAETQYESGVLIFASWSVTTETLTQFYEYSLVDMPSPQSTYYRFKIVAQNLISQNFSNETVIGVFAKANSASDLVDNAITQNTLAPDAVTAEKIAAGTITAEQIAAEDILVKGARAGMVSTEGLIVDDSAFLASQPLSYKYTDPVTKEEKHYPATAGEFFVGNSPDVDDNRDVVEFLHYKPGLGFWFKIKNFIIKGLATIIQNIFRVKNSGTEDKDSFFIVNPTYDIDYETGTLFKTAKVKGTFISEIVYSPKITLKESALLSLIKVDISESIYLIKANILVTATFIDTQPTFGDRYLYKIYKLDNDNLNSISFIFEVYGYSFSDLIVDDTKIIIAGWVGTGYSLCIYENGTKNYIRVKDSTDQSFKVYYLDKLEGDYKYLFAIKEVSNRIIFYKTNDFEDLYSRTFFDPSSSKAYATNHDIKELFLNTENFFCFFYGAPSGYICEIYTKTNLIYDNTGIYLEISFYPETIFDMNKTLYALENTETGVKIYKYDKTSKSLEVVTTYNDIYADDFVFDETTQKLYAMKEKLIIFDGTSFTEEEFLPEFSKKLIAISKTHYLFMNMEKNKYLSIKRDDKFLPIISDEDVTELNTWSAKKIEELGARVESNAAKKYTITGAMGGTKYVKIKGNSNFSTMLLLSCYSTKILFSVGVLENGDIAQCRPLSYSGYGIAGWFATTYTDAISPYTLYLKVINWASVEIITNEEIEIETSTTTDFLNQDFSKNYLSIPTVKKQLDDNNSTGIVIASATDVTLSSYGNEPLSIGSKTSTNIGIDGNEIQARNNGSASPIYINGNGGNIFFGKNDKYYISEDGSKYNGTSNATSSLDSSALTQVLNKFFPIGTIVTTTSSTAPAYGGTWVQIAQGRTLIGAGTGTDSNSVSKSFSVNGIGGEYNHTLTTGELPAHTHSISANSVSKNGVSYKLGGTGTNVYTYGSKSTSSVGSGTSHNNIQPYLVVYFWKRTA
ncbi:MAG: hypothetical protein J6K22_08050 [Spirochaetaceae bacterium]|nr:hypothetical protein [Spirochaetaceae bacterium]